MLDMALDTGDDHARMGEDEKRKAVELANDAARLALATTSPWSFGRVLLDVLIRIHRGESVPGLPDYPLDWLNDVSLDLRA